MINYRKWMSLSASILGLLVVTTNFQNCAPPSTSLNGAISSSSESSGGAGFPNIIDDSTTTTALRFTEKAIAVGEAEEDVVAQGECFEEQNGAILSWALMGSNESIMQTGHAGCEAGSFEVAINDLQEVPCGDYKIQARLGFGEMGEVDLSIACE